MLEKLRKLIVFSFCFYPGAKLKREGEREREGERGREGEREGERERERVCVCVVVIFFNEFFLQI